MNVVSPSHAPWQEKFRRRIERLDSLPLRASTVRHALGSLPDDGAQDTPDQPQENSRSLGLTEIDPGWVIARMCARPTFDSLGLIAVQPWWTAVGGTAADAFDRLWRHSVGVSLAARRLAREAGDDNPELVARAGLLSSLGYWAAAALEPDWLGEWFAEPDVKRRRAQEISQLGIEPSRLGRLLAERWGCDRLVVEAAWLHGDRDGGLNTTSSDPRRLALIQEAYAIAERTPWSLGALEARDLATSDARLRLLIAEVQIHCSSPFLDLDVTPHEVRLSRSNASLRRQLARQQAEASARQELINALGQSSSTESPSSWSERAGLAFCALPGVTTARVVWKGPNAGEVPKPEPRASDRAPSRRLELNDRGRINAEVELWGDVEQSHAMSEIDELLPAWRSWASLVADRAGLDHELNEVVRVYRERVASEEPRLRRSKLDSLAEFAAGAGHELNNPLAVIVGRAQLLLGKETDPNSVRSLRTILSQAQRTHRILRDLMFIARTPESRPRFCQPDELVRASLRDFKPEAEIRGVRIGAEEVTQGLRVWEDPDALRHLFDILIRNALESTPKGGMVHVTLDGDTESLRWSVKDSGRGMTHSEGQHLFDPFFCGRQAGRGLGLGLSRAARIVSQAGGELHWNSTPGHGTIFRVHLPLKTPPKSHPAELEKNGAGVKSEMGLPND